jgi:hypothetical protein
MNQYIALIPIAIFLIGITASILIGLKNNKKHLKNPQ